MYASNNDHCFSCAHDITAMKKTKQMLIFSKNTSN